MNNEIRNIETKFEVREVGEGKEKETHIQGYALTFGTISEDLGYRETIAKGALDNSDMSNVVLNFNHNSNSILARNTKINGIGSLILTIDEKGLFFDAIPTDTSYSRDLIENMKQGIISKCSFAFSLDYRDKESVTYDWDDGNRGYDFVTINKIKSLHDVSIVVNPAYESTSTALYSRGKQIKEEEVRSIKEQKEKELRKRKLLLELM